METQELYNTTAAAPPSQLPTTEDYERIKTRLSELMEILLDMVGQDQEAQSMGLTAMGPIILLMIQNFDGPKLIGLLTSLSGISKAVATWDSSQESYEDAMVPLIGMLEESLK